MRTCLTISVARASSWSSVRRRKPENESALWPVGGVAEVLICSSVRGKAAPALVVVEVSAACLKCLLLARKAFQAFLSVELQLKAPSSMSCEAAFTGSSRSADAALEAIRMSEGFSGVRLPLRGMVEKK